MRSVCFLTSGKSLLITTNKWQPRILVVTGSNGKTTLLHLLESQFGRSVKYSHHANSSYGIPFDILGLERKSLLKSEWIGLFLKAPFAAFQKPPKESIYIIEADCDRPGEGKFLASFLRPEVVLWVSTAKTHSMNFDELVTQGKFRTVEEAIAYEFGYFLECCKKLVVINNDLPLVRKQTDRTKAKIIKISKNHLKRYEVTANGSTFVTDKFYFTVKGLVPEEVYYALLMCREAVMHFE